MELTGQQLLAYCKDLSPRAIVRLGVGATVLAAVETVVLAALGDQAFALLAAMGCGACLALTLRSRNGSVSPSRRLVPDIAPRTRRWLDSTFENSTFENSIREKRLLVLAVVALIVPVIVCWASGILMLANGVPFLVVAAGLTACGLIWIALAARPRLRYPRRGPRSVR